MGSYPALKKLVFVQPPYPDLYYLLNHLEDKHGGAIPNIGGVILHEADYSLIYEANASSIPVYLGGAWVPYSGPGTRYFEGMMNDQWRWNAMQAQIARIQQTYSTVVNLAGFYITEEADLASLTHEGLRYRLGWFMQGIIRACHALRPGMPIIWSPWGSGAITTTKVAAVQSFIANVIGWLRISDKINPNFHLSFQDGLGAKHHSLTEARLWGTSLNNLARTNDFNLGMNVEYYRRPSENIYEPEDKAIIISRESHYFSHGLNINALWEARYFYPRVGFYPNHSE